MSIKNTEDFKSKLKSKIEELNLNNQGKFLLVFEKDDKTINLTLCEIKDDNIYEIKKSNSHFLFSVDEYKTNYVKGINILGALGTTEAAKKMKLNLEVKESLHNYLNTIKDSQNYSVKKTKKPTL
jgi:hypothetical protein